MGRRTTSAAGEPVSIRISEDLKKSLLAASDLLELSYHDTIRLAAKVGIEDLRRIGWDLAGAVVDKAKGREEGGAGEDPASRGKTLSPAKVVPMPESEPIAAETPKPYKAKKLA